FAVPPRTNAREAELHGMIDSKGIVEPMTIAVLTGKDASLAEAKIVTTGPPPDNAPVETGYSVLRVGDPLPYLPEPLANVIAARIFDHPDFPADKIIPIP